MSVTTLDPSSALLVIDLQCGLADLPTLDPVRDVASRTARVAAAFREHRLPVVLVTAPGRTDAGNSGGDGSGTDYPPDFADLLPELDHRDADHRLTKQRWGAFHDTGLAEHLRSVKVTQVVLAGVATSVGVESTARAAYDEGFHVTIAADAVTDVDADAHRNSLQRIFPRLAEVGTTDDILAVLTTST